MLNAYYSKGCDSLDLFKNQKIYNDTTFKTHLNKHNVIYIDMNAFYTILDNKNIFVIELQKGIIKLLEEYDMFLRSLFKSTTTSSVIDLVYMTGINANIKTNGDNKEYLYDTLIEVVNI